MSERDLERALKVLGSAEPPEGMERRILARLNAEQTVGGCWTRPGWMVVGGVALAGVMAAVLLPTAHERLGGVAPVGTKVLRMGHASPVEIRGVEAACPVGSGGGRVGQRVVALRTMVREDPSSEMKFGHETDLSAWNHPAPPMPLTDQEKMLLRLAHRGDPAELVKLNSEAREAQSAAEVAEFKEFFVQPDFLVKPKMENNQ